MVTAVATAAAFALLNMQLLRLTRNATLAGHAALSVLFVLLTLSNIHSGGFYDPNFAWYYVIPLASVILVSPPCCVGVGPGS